jgi:hypothetical protein
MAAFFRGRLTATAAPPWAEEGNETMTDVHKLEDFGAGRGEAEPPQDDPALD